VWWNVYTALYSKFPAESDSERIFKIGLVLTKLQPKFRGFVFWNTVYNGLRAQNAKSASSTRTYAVLTVKSDSLVESVGGLFVWCKCRQGGSIASQVQLKVIP